MMLASQQSRGALIFDNIPGLIEKGMIETAIFEAYIHGPHMHPESWRYLFAYANRQKLRACGDAIPDGPFVVYRGVRNIKHRAWRRGLSWTTKPSTAAWFTTRFATPEDDPAVYSLTVTAEDVLFMTNERAEDEVVVSIWDCGRIKRLNEIPQAIKPSHTK